jgi:hypothetical protein
MDGMDALDDLDVAADVATSKTLAKAPSRRRRSGWSVVVRA